MRTILAARFDGYLKSQEASECDAIGFDGLSDVQSASTIDGLLAEAAVQVQASSHLAYMLRTSWQQHGRDGAELNALLAKHGLLKADAAE